MAEANVRFADGTLVPADGESHVDPSNPMVSRRILTIQEPPSVQEIIDGGNTASIGINYDGNILKFPRETEDAMARRALDIEAQILEALGNHNRIVRYLGRTADGLLFARAINGNMKTYMHQCASSSLSVSQRWIWSLQATEALAYVHSHGVIHSDIHPNNFLVDQNLDVCLCDFSGSVFGRLDGQAMESTRFWLPRDPLATPTIESDLFALGSLLYWIFCGEEPYSKLEEPDVISRFERMDFPSTDGLLCGATIVACWQRKFESARHVMDALQSAHPA